MPKKEIVTPVDLYRSAYAFNGRLEQLALNEKRRFLALSPEDHAFLTSTAQSLLQLLAQAAPEDSRPDADGRSDTSAFDKAVETQPESVTHQVAG